MLFRLRYEHFLFFIFRLFVRSLCVLFDALLLFAAAVAAVAAIYYAWIIFVMCERELCLMFRIDHLNSHLDVLYIFSVDITATKIKFLIESFTTSCYFPSFSFFYRCVSVSLLLIENVVILQRFFLFGFN